MCKGRTILRIKKGLIQGIWGRSALVVGPSMAPIDRQSDWTLQKTTSSPNSAVHVDLRCSTGHTTARTRSEPKGKCPNSKQTIWKSVKLTELSNKFCILDLIWVFLSDFCTQNVKNRILFRIQTWSWLVMTGNSTRWQAVPIIASLGTCCWGITLDLCARPLEWLDRKRKETRIENKKVNCPWQLSTS